VDWFGSVRGRLGIANDHWLAYFTGGYAYGHVVNGDNIAGVGVARFDEVRNGWTIGGGLEYAFMNDLTARIEYRHTDYGKKSYGPVAVGPGVFVPHTFELTTNQVLLGLSYKFSSR